MRGKRESEGRWREEKTLLLATAGLLMALPNPALACAACYGQSDSPLAAGMNWGILSLLVLIVLVLGGVTGFFVFLARRAGGGEFAAEQPSLPGVQDMEAMERGDITQVGLAMGRRGTHPGARPTCLSEPANWR